MTNPLFGISAAFDLEIAWRAAIQKTKAAGYQKIEAYAPFPDDEAISHMKLSPSRLPLYTLLGGTVGAIGAFYLQYYTAVVQFPLDVGGRALNSWQAFMPITFEGTVLCAALSLLAGFFIESRFPQPYHPMFNIDDFAQASSHRYFLTIMADDENFQTQATGEFLRSLSSEVYDVPR